MRRQFLAICLVVASLHTAGNANAQESAGYLGYRAGIYDYNYKARSDNQWAHGPYAGYRFGRFIAAEVEYLVLRETSEDAPFKGNAGIASLRPTLPLGPRWELYAKLGWTWLDGEVNPKEEDRRAGATSESIKQDFATFGLGAGFKIGRFEGRMEYLFDELDLTDNQRDFGVWSLGVNFNF